MDRPPPSLGRVERLFLGAGLIVAVWVWAISLSLRPDSRGYGTHVQLGLAPCPKLVQTGWPCLTCGMTTAFAYAARGRLWRALDCQPFGALLFVGIMGGGVMALRALRRQQSMMPWLVRLLPWKFLGLLYLLLALLVASWAYKARGPIKQWLHQPTEQHQT
jgi:hypothetical protein